MQVLINKGEALKMLRFINELIYISVITIFICMYSEFHYSLAFYGLASIITLIKYEIRKEQMANKRI